MNPTRRTTLSIVVAVIATVTQPLSLAAEPLPDKGPISVYLLGG